MNVSRDKKPSLLWASGATAVATLVSRILGLARDAVLAAFFSKELTDVFWAAFRIPNTFRRLFGEGAVSVAFLPVFIAIRKKEGEEAARGLLGRVFLLVFAATGTVTVLGLIFAPFIVSLLLDYPKDGSAAELEATAAVLVRWMFPYLIFICLAAIVSGVLYATGRFFVAGLTPIYLNAAIILGAYLSWDAENSDLRWLAGSVLVGGFLQFASQLPSLWRSGTLPSLLSSGPEITRGVTRIMRLFLPASLGLGVQPINILVNTYFASTLGPGAISYLYYADRLVQFPLGVFGFAIATAAFPRFSEEALEKNREALKKPLLQSIHAIFLVMLPSTLGLWILGGPIIDVVLNRGAFAVQGSLESTLSALQVYALGLIPFSLIKLVGNLSFAVHDGRSPVVAGLVAAAANLCMAWWFSSTRLAHAGIALAVVLAATLNLCLLLYRLRRTIRASWLLETLPTLVRLVVGNGLMGIALWVWLDWTASLAAAWVVAGGMAVGGAVYLGSGWVLFPDLVQWLLKRGKREKQAGNGSS